ncbi:unnamed protein product [Protopolystoma xenopodis]|uniref:Stress-induced-phosphoprotein 1 n=1 Tax=Protopolystoma xenopodis TaxID=117903 RepID=A0A3S5AXP7_9PLAT|nr:unnamed protein product [Protopolystoma xenopodis]
MSDVLKDKGNLALKEGDYKSAVGFYSQGINADPENHVLYSNRSVAYFKSGDYSKALSDADECVRLNVNWSKGHSRRASALEALSRYQEAHEAYSQALKLDPGNEQLSYNLELVSSKFAAQSLKEKLAFDPKLRGKMSDPDFASKIKFLEENPMLLASLSQNDYDMKNLLHTLGMDDADNGASEEDTVLNKGKQKTPEPRSVLSDEQEESLKAKELGNAAYKRRDFELALQHYDKAIEIDSSNMNFYLNKSAVYFELGEYPKCVELCEKAVEVGREQRADYKLIAKAYARAGSCFEKTADLVNAKKYYDKSLSEFRAQDIIKKAQRIDKELKEQERLAYISPELSEIEKNKGNSAFTRGDWPGALKHYSEAIRRNPSDPKIYSNRAACYTKLMEFPMALKDCDKCIELAPEFIKGYLRKAACLVAMKDFGAARKAYRKALELEPNCEEAREGLFQCFSSDTDPASVRERAMNDPEVASILSDPAMRMILSQMEDPAALREHLKNPDIASKLIKLIDAGLISLR